MSNLSELREQIQNDIICCVESDSDIVQRFPDLLDNLCQIVVNKFNERIEGEVEDEVLIKARKWDEHVRNLAEHGGV